MRGLRATKGKTVLVFEDDVVALVQHLFDAGLVEVDNDGRAFNVNAELFRVMKATKQRGQRRPSTRPVRRAKR